ncbi:zinc finger CCCH domain-containing protein 3 [Musa acuminata AAA Group]|uniref:C3H1-type domain-containing protein n=1 Tax=Musa acuminata subsp. malaccensis TaxID=214687 RepID=A0A804HN45_MUSAM|nr:PREDICTED: zinc finger CCCH domain-containing protein 3 isoform X1 [Musa acuminata subsp. malaccensis]
MPLGKYYCDYCDKQFQDTPAARKRHLQGLHHHRARALWYDSFKEPHGAPLFQPYGSLAKGVCHHFVRTGVCKYGDTCKYFHPKQDVLNPTPAVTGMKYMEAIQIQNSLASNLPGDSMSGNIINQGGISWGNLPPSLRPPPEGGYPPLLFLEWG